MNGHFKLSYPTQGAKASSRSHSLSNNNEYLPLSCWLNVQEIPKTIQDAAIALGYLPELEGNSIKVEDNDHLSHRA